MLNIYKQNNWPTPSAHKSIILGWRTITLCCPTVTTDQLNNIEPYDRVTINAQAVKVKPPTTISTGKQKQDVIVGDETGTATLSIWGQDIGILTKKCYQPNRIEVHCYLGNSLFPHLEIALRKLKIWKMFQPTY